MPGPPTASEIWAEVWTRPGHASFGRVRPWVPVSDLFWHDGINLIGDGKLSVVSRWDGIDDIIRGEPDNPALSKRALIRFFSALDPTKPMDWLPQTADPDGDKLDLFTSISGIGIKGLLGHARVEAWDWDGEDDFEPEFPDWVYGGRNILGNPEFDSENTTPTRYLLAIDATGGTFRLSDGTDQTEPIPHNPSDNRIEFRIELQLGEFDDVLVSPASGNATGYELRITADAGTFTISDGTDETLPIAWNASFATIKTRIETDLGTVVTVDVSAGEDPDPGDETRYVDIDMVDPVVGTLSLGDHNVTEDGDDGFVSLYVSKTSDRVFDIEYVLPPFGPELSIVDNLLTGGTASLTMTEEGNWDPSPWTRSQQISIGTPREFGVYDEFEIRDWDGYRTMYIDPGFVDSELTRYAGLQQVVSTIPGGLYQTGIWVWPTAPGQQYRLIMREIDEDVLKTTTSPLVDSPSLVPGLAWINVSPPAGQWTLVEVPNVIASEQATIFRFANIDGPGVNPAPFYVRSAFMTEGMPAATLGRIGWELYRDATEDHAPNRRVWYIDGTVPDEFFLVPTFDDFVDSNGDPWDRELSVTITMRKSYSQMMADMVKNFGYEYSITPIDVEGGVWGWNAYNPGAMMVDHTGDVGPAIQGGARDTRRSYERRAPGATHFMVEGEGGVTARAENVGLVSALGRIETSELNRELSTLEMLSLQAAEQASVAAESLDLLTFTLVDPIDAPTLAFTFGDMLNIVDPPEVPLVPRRFVDLSLNVTPELVEWECQFGQAAASTPESAVADAVTGLLLKFEYPDRVGGGIGALGLGGGLAPTRVVGVPSGYSQDRVDVLGDGLFDEEEINLLLSTASGRLLVTEGTYSIRPDRIQLFQTMEGMGRTTIFRQTSEASVFVIRIGSSTGCLRHVVFGDPLCS